MIKMVSSDLDGTLLTGGSQTIPEEIFSLIKELKDMGILFVAASGRQYANMRNLFLPVRDDMAFISENGGLAIQNEKLLYCDSFDTDLVMAIIEAIHEGRLNERLTEILNYINTNYLTVTLDELEEQFHLSKPYLSKYIKEKSGKTFGELVKNVRMKKARTLLKGGNMTVESIAEKVGYQNVEHFTRLFKKKYGMTPVQFRNEEK